MTPQASDLPSAGGRSSATRIRPSQASTFTQGRVTQGPRSRQIAEQRMALEEQRRTGRVAGSTTFPMQSLTASAKRLTSKKLREGTFKKTTAQGWQEDAWEMWDLVGEQHFLGTTLANQASKARFYVGRLGEGNDVTDMPEPDEDKRLQEVLDAIGGGPVGMAQMVQRMLVNLWVAGDGWFVGIPKAVLPDYEPDPDVDEIDDEGNLVYQLPDLAAGEELSMADLEWRMLSVSEVTMHREGKVKLHLGEADSEKLLISPDLLYMIRVWRPHPRRWWEADSPTRSSLPVLRELVGLTMHISAQVDSRLAGAGMLLVPASAARALKLAANLPEDSPEDPFTDALMEAMLTPIGDRGNASALVPLVVTVPDGTASEFQYLNFSKPLDTEARALRDEAIRRLALGQDAPPELLLGTAGMNHWGAWLVRDDVVTTHIEPPLALVADALTVQYLRPMMLEMGYPLAEVKKHVIWYDVSNMVVRPNRASDALTLYDRDELGGKALREASGFDETDAPDSAKMDLASQTAFDMVKENPALMQNPGLPELVNQLRALIAGAPVPLPEKLKKEAKAAGVPLGADGKPIPTTNPQAGAPGTAPASAPAQPARTNPGAPPAQPTESPEQARPTPGATAAEVEAFSRLVEGIAQEGDAEMVAASAERTDTYGQPAELKSVDTALSRAMGRKGRMMPATESEPASGDEDIEQVNGAIVVLIPSDDDPVNSMVRTGYDPHMTLAWIAEDLDVSELTEGSVKSHVLGMIETQVRAAAGRNPFTSLTLDVESAGQLGDSISLFLGSSIELEGLLGDLTRDGSVLQAANAQVNEHADQEFLPHIGLYYGEDALEVFEDTEGAYDVLPASVTFDRIGVWIGDEHYDFNLGSSDLAVSDTAATEAEEEAEAEAELAEYATETFMGQPVMNSRFNHAATN